MELGCKKQEQGKQGLTAQKEYREKMLKHMQRGRRKGKTGGVEISEMVRAMRRAYRQEEDQTKLLSQINFIQGRLPSPKRTRYRLPELKWDLLA